MDEVFTVPEAAQFLRVHEQTVYQLLREGRLKGVKVGRSWRIHRHVLESFVAEASGIRFGTGEFDDGRAINEARLQFLQTATQYRPAIFAELLALRPHLDAEGLSIVEIAELLRHPEAAKMLPRTPEDAVTLKTDAAEFTQIRRSQWRETWDDLLAGVRAWQVRWHLLDSWCWDAAIYTIADGGQWRLPGHWLRLLHPEPQVFVYDLRHERVDDIIARLRARLMTEKAEYEAAGFEVPPIKENPNHFLWLARFQIGEETPPAIAGEYYDPKTVYDGIRRTAQLIGLTLRAAPRGRPRKHLKNSG